MMSSCVSNHISSTRTIPTRQTVVCQATKLPKKFKAVKPVGDRVLVKIDKKEPKSKGGILLPESARTKPTAGTVVAVGDVITVKVNDRVYYSQYAGTEMLVSDQSFLLLKEDDCIGLLPGDKISELKPLGDRILIKAARQSDKSTGGVILTEAQEKPTFGEVVAVGPGKRDKKTGEVSKPSVAVGGTVMHAKYSGSEFEEGISQYTVVRESDVLAALA